jgi:hypothetical protein
MCMTPTRSINAMHTLMRPLTIVLLLVVASPAMAQSPAGNSLPKASQADRLNWPRTFTGQPDFAFTRDEALIESRRRAAQDNLPLPTAPTLEALLTDQGAPDPLKLGAGSAVSLTEAFAEAAKLVADTTLPSTPGSLPDLGNGPVTDLSGFRQNLPQLLAQSIAEWQPDLAQYDFSFITRQLTLQAIVLSPLTYTVINQQRYQAGDTFMLVVPLDVPDQRLEQALLSALPPSNTMSLPDYAAYTEAVQAQMAAFQQARSANPAIGQQQVRIPVRVVAITARHVALEVNGQPFELAIRYAY